MNEVPVVTVTSENDVTTITVTGGHELEACSKRKVIDHDITCSGGLLTYAKR